MGQRARGWGAALRGVRGVAGERLPGRARVLRMPFLFTSFQSDRRGIRRGSDKAVAQWRLAVMVLTLVLVLA